MDPEQRAVGSQNSAFHSLAMHTKTAGRVCRWSSGCVRDPVTCGHQKSIWVLGACVTWRPLIISFMSGLESGMPLLSCSPVW